MKWTLRLVVLLFMSGTLAVAGLPVAPSSAQATPTLTVTPHTGLVGGDDVVLNGSGFPPSVFVDFCQGVITPQESPNDCGTSTGEAQTNDAGEFSVPFTVFRFITPANGMGLIDCAQSTTNCGFGAVQISPFFGQPVVTPITFTPQDPATAFAINGTVTGPDGHALPNAPVWAYTAADSFVGSLQTVTDASGAYSLDIAAQTYGLRFGPPAGTDLVAEWFDNETNRATSHVTLPKSFNDPNEIVTADAQLEAGGAIAGTVTDTSGSGVSGVTVWAYGPTDTWVGSFGTTTAADGSFQISGVRAANYQVRFMPPGASGLAIEWFDNAALRASATPVTVAGGSTTSGINAELEPSS